MTTLQQLRDDYTEADKNSRKFRRRMRAAKTLLAKRHFQALQNHWLAMATLYMSRLIACADKKGTPLSKALQMKPTKK